MCAKKKRQQISVEVRSNACTFKFFFLKIQRDIYDFTMEESLKQEVKLDYYFLKTPKTAMIAEMSLDLHIVLFCEEPLAN